MERSGFGNDSGNAIYKSAFQRQHGHYCSNYLFLCLDSVPTQEFTNDELSSNNLKI